MCDCIGQALELGMSRRGFFKSGWKLAGAAGLPLLVGQPLNAAEVSNREAAVSASKVAAQQFDTRLVLLGTAGGPVWWPNCDREGISSALVVGDAVYVVDCGDGVGKRYKQAGLGQNNLVSGMSGMENLRGIFLTHLHSDQPEQLETATAVWFTEGGDDAAPVPDDLKDELRRRHDQGLLLGGSGAAVANGSGIDIGHPN